MKARVPKENHCNRLEKQEKKNGGNGPMRDLKEAGVKDIT